MKTLFLAFEQRLTSFIIHAACVMLGIAALLGMFQVLTRFIFNEPSTWSEILIRLDIIWMVMFGVVVAFREGAQVSVDLMFRKSGRFQRPLHFLITLVTVIYLAVLVWYGADIAWRTRFQEIGALEFLPMSVGYAALPVGAIFGIIAVIANFLDPRIAELDAQQ
ncbi:MAG: C4-dicarboxylate transporter permease [Proteobacteria bacterium]|nr:C4-dicarboxylate transporter permease [Pseudomonadota bacterium]